MTDLRWGTPSPVTVRDPDFKMVQVRANGLCVLRIADPEIFLREVIGTDSTVTTEEIAELLRRIITLAFSDMIMATGMGAIELQGRQVELSDKLRDFVQERVDDEFGLKIDSVTMNITLPEEITQAMTRGVARGVEQARYLDNVGPMDRLQQGAAAEAMVEAARNPGGGAGSMMGAGHGHGARPADGQHDGGRPAGGYGQPQQGGYAAAGRAAPAAAGPDCSTPRSTARRPDRSPSTSCGSTSTAGQLNPNSNVWATGMPNWVAAQTVPALAPLFAPSDAAAAAPAGSPGVTQGPPGPPQGRPPYPPQQYPPQQYPPQPPPPQAPPPHPPAAAAPASPPPQAHRQRPASAAADAGDPAVHRADPHLSVPSVRRAAGLRHPHPSS